MAKPHFSKFVEGRIGSFHHGLAMVEVRVSTEAYDLMDQPSMVHKYKAQPERQFQLLLEMNSIVHERIHYLDTFGTLAGISLLSSRFELLREFIEVGGRMARQRKRWKLPLANWISDADVPPDVKQLAKLAIAYRQTDKLFEAAVEPFMVEGQTEDVWVELPLSAARVVMSRDIKIPAFPQSIAIRDPAGKRPDRPVTVFHPLGYQAILEGRAHSMARSWMETKFPDVPVELFSTYGPPRAMPAGEFLGQFENDAANWFAVYNMTDYMISKFLRGRGVHQFSRDLVLGLSDRALSESILFIDSSNANAIAASVRSPGTVLVELMDELPPIDTPTVTYPERTTEMYRSTLEKLERGGDWQTVTGSEPYRALRVWESFIAHHITVPLLRQRLETNHAVYANGNDLLRLAISDLPRVEVINDQLKFHLIPDEVRSAWAKQMFLGEIAEQIFGGAKIIRCPRAHRLLPGLTSIDFAGGKCNTYVRRGCGSCTEGVPSLSLSCLFNSTLIAYGLVEGPETA